jgi:predicted TIM-barrel fold metal-dependent hydrolase
MSKPYPIVDAHHHWVPQSHLERLEAFMGPGESVRRRPNGSTRSSLMRNGEDIYNMDEAVVANTDARLKDMDEAGVDIAVLQLGIWLEFLNLETARETNDELAKIQRETNGRLIGLAHVPPRIEGAE